jgi:hypothetical protein
MNVHMLARSSTQLAALALAGVLLAPGPRYAAACSCAPTTPAQELQQSATVFEGEVVAVERPIGAPRLIDTFPFVTFAPQPAAPTLVTFRVSAVWKGVPYQTIVLRTTRSLCDPEFERGQRYLIYAADRGRGIELRICGRVRLAAQAQEDRGVLGIGAPPSITGSNAHVMPGGLPIALFAVVVALVVAIFLVARRKSGLAQA